MPDKDRQKVIAVDVDGMFTRVALDVFKTEGPMIYADWYHLIRQRLPSQSHPQTPQIQGTPTMKKWRIFE